ncbi:MAG: Decaprenylphosphoryl-beta-D-ribose oxidase [Chlamydiia bacterium]|nr:Decaprenylphosphoryl-beta-D-ribose oxidase [Chlamydiia bacterium]MCH9618108.1 Decaprenylphosphoryl-beta-D-ribose oxidase [Chlamydiia bacterium]MCH9623988.1 Decaprenylphosphoryl-beta-D-ribose oxidase [Chlamydiia bacterium]
MNLYKYILLLAYFSASPFYGNETRVCYGKMYAAEMQVEKPFLIKEVQQIVLRAKAEGKKISILGAGLSQGPQSLLGGGILVDMQKINHMHIKDKKLIVGAGAKWADVQKYINKEKLSLQVMQGGNIFSVGGSISANIHGWDFRSGTIYNTISKLTIIDSQGKLRSVEKKDPLFSYIIGGYGCFGIIAEVEMLLTDNLPLQKETVIVESSHYVKHLEENVLPDQRVIMHHYCLSIDPKQLLKNGVATNFKTINKASTTSNLVVSNNAENISKIGAWSMRNFPTTKTLLWNMRKKLMLKQGVHTRNQLMSPPSALHFAAQKNKADWLQEFFIPKEEFSSFIDFLRKTMQKNEVNLLNSTVRYVKAHKQKGLSYAPYEDRISIVLFWSQSLQKEEIEKTKAWVQLLTDEALERNGSFYLPYQQFATIKQFQKSYPDYKDFERMKSQVDPDHLFLSEFYQNYFE